MAVPGRVATGQQLEGKMRPRSFLFFFSRRDASKFTRFQLALRERVRLFDSAELPRRQEGGIPKPGRPAGLGGEGDTSPGSLWEETRRKAVSNSESRERSRQWPRVYFKIPATFSFVLFHGPFTLDFSPGDDNHASHLVLQT